jgi:transcriptional regulator with GAF, ATPase, and Fis domain
MLHLDPRFRGNRHREASTDAAKMSEDVERFYQCLLALSDHPFSERILDDALSAIVAVTNARLAFVEFYDEHKIPRYWRGHHVDKQSLDTIRASVCRDIVARAISERQTIATTARSDFVLCIPIRAVPVGALYLQSGADSFSSLDRERAELLVAMLRNRPELDADETKKTLHEHTQALQHRLVRAAVSRCAGNISRAARELGVSRAFLYGLMRR